MDEITLANLRQEAVEYGEDKRLLSAISKLINAMDRYPGWHGSGPPRTILAFQTAGASGHAMHAHTRAMIAAAAFAFVSGRKVAGLYDHSAAKHLRIAAEARGEHLQAYDGDRNARLGGTLPELYDAGDGVFVQMEVEGAKARG